VKVTASRMVPLAVLGNRETRQTSSLNLLQKMHLVEYCLSTSIAIAA
jgi:hypothetical protein